jgi:hypothetical protein
MGAVIRNADAAHADLPISASGRGAVHGKTLAVRALFAGRAHDAHAVLPDTTVLVANLVLLAGPGAAQLIETLSARTALSVRTLHAHAVGVDALTLVADFAVIRTIAIGAILRVTPAVGAPKPVLAGHIDTRTSPADAVHANLTLAKAAHIAAICGIAEAAGAALSLGAGHPHATALHAFLVDADFPVTGAFLGLAVDGIALPGRTALPLRTGHTHAAGRLALLVDAHLSLAGAIPPDAVFRIALSPGAGGSLRAVLVQAGDLHAGFVFADETLGTVAHQAVERQAITAYYNPVLAYVVINSPGGAGNHHRGQASPQHHQTDSAKRFFHRTHLHLEDR